MQRPGVIARWRAGRGVTHPRGGVTVGYRSALEAVYLTKREMGHHGMVFGSPGSGKSTLLSLLIQGHSKLGPVIVIDGKGSPVLRESVRFAGGLVWTIGGSLKLDLLDPDPTVLADQLTEASRHAGPSEVYAEAAARAIQWCGHVLHWQGITPTLEAIEDLLLEGALKKALQPFKARPRVGRWLAELEDMTDVELSGMRTALMRITRLIDSAAGPGLGAGVDAARFEDVVQGRTTLLLSLDGRRYPALSRIIAGWALIGLQRACLAVPKGTACLMVVDELGSFEWQARHVEPLLALARDQGVGVVLAAHGPTQLDAAHKGLASQVLQMTAWQIVLAQGDPYDADRLAMLFPLDQTKPQTMGTHLSGTPQVTRDHLRALRRGDCFYSVGARDGLDARWGHARIALPYVLGQATETPTECVLIAEETTEEAPIDLTEGVQGNTEEDERSLVYKRVRTIDGWRMWRGNFDKDGYPRQWIPKLKKYQPAARMIYLWEGGDIPRGWELDHECGLRDCLDHLNAKTKAANTKNRDARARGEIPTGHAGLRGPGSAEAAAAAR